MLEINTKGKPTSFLECNNSSVLDCAEFYASQGLQPIKVLHKQKKPFEKEWEQLDYGTPEKAIKAFKTHKGNIGIRGDETGVMGIDFDIDSFKQAMLNELPMLNETLQSKGKKETGHYWIRLIKPLKNQSIRKHFEDRTKETYADLRGIGGMIVVAPSIHPDGNKYEWLNNNPILPLDTNAFLNALDVACKEVNVKNPYRKEPVIETREEPNSIYKEVKKSVSIRGYLNTTADRINCPVHKEVTPSQAMRIYPDTQSVHCFSCGFSGDVISLHAKIKGLTNLEATKDLAKQHGIELEKEIIKTTKELITSWVDYTHLGKQLVNNTPVYYDKARLWWVWNETLKAWEKSDETDLFIAVEEALRNASFTTKSQTKNEILEVLRRIGRRNSPKEPKKTWVQFGGRVYDVITGETFNASPEWFMTNPIPYEVGESEDTPTIDRLFREWVVGKDQDETWARTLHEVCAYTLLNQQPLQKLFALNGAGSNGKGCFVKLLQRFIGENNYVATELSLLSDKNVRFETSFIYRKLAVLMTELQESELKNTVLLKKISGEDTLRYEFKGKDGFSEHSYATCILSTNSLPTTRDKTAGYYRRWLIIDFPNTFEVTGKDIIEEIPDLELENWAKKLLRIGKEILERGKFTNEGDTAEKERRYEERSNPIQHFINENYEEEPDEFEVFSIFYKRLTEWLRKNNIRKISAREAGGRLRSDGYDIQKQNVSVKTGATDNYGYEKEKHSTRNVVYGIKWRERIA